MSANAEPEQVVQGSSEPQLSDELTVLIRGFFSLPVMSGLGRLGVLQELVLRREFTVHDFPKIPNKKLLELSFRYLTRLGLLVRATPEENKWTASELGRQIFQRASSFYVPHSYHEYMAEYFNQLQNSSASKNPAVDRLENIIGSGRTHQRYFPYAVSFLKRRIVFDWIVDLGCGDGHFLEAVMKSIPRKNAVGIDLSEIAIQTTRKHLQEKYPDRHIHMICSDAGDVPKWGKALRAISQQSSIVISMWFLLHEISNDDPARVIRFLSEIHALFPNATLVIGEIVRQKDAALAESSKSSIMPEYLFFHDLSGQGVLSWEEYREILSHIPYTLASERLFDEMDDGNGKREPSSFIWCLTPK